MAIRRRGVLGQGPRRLRLKETIELRGEFPHGGQPTGKIVIVERRAPRRVRLARGGQKFRSLGPRRGRWNPARKAAVAQRDHPARHIPEFVGEVAVVAVEELLVGVAAVESEAHLAKQEVP